MGGFQQVKNPDGLTDIIFATLTGFAVCSLVGRNATVTGSSNKTDNYKGNQYFFHDFETLSFKNGVRGIKRIWTLSFDRKGIL